MYKFICYYNIVLVPVYYLCRIIIHGIWKPSVNGQINTNAVLTAADPVDFPRNNIASMAENKHKKNTGEYRALYIYVDVGGSHGV